MQNHSKKILNNQGQVKQNQEFYKPKIIESFAKIQRQTKLTLDSKIKFKTEQHSEENQKKLVRHILQQENYQVFERSESHKKSRMRKVQKLENLQQLLKKVGIKNQVSAEKNLPITKSFSKSKDQTFLPQIRNKNSKSLVSNKRIKTQGPNIQSFKNKKNQCLRNHSLKQKKSFSEKRLRQDYKYLFQKDDSLRYHQRSKPLLNEQKKKVNLLKIKQEMLGKILLERVNSHVQNSRNQSASYITKIKSQKMIDQALIEFIKTKVKRVDQALK